MLITKQWLEEKGACNEGIQWFLNHKYKTVNSLVQALIKDIKFDWAIWLLIRVFNHKQNVLFSCFSASLSLKYFEKKYPEDKRPRLAIEAAIKWANNPTVENQSAARSAAESADGSAVESAWAAAESAAGSAAESAAWAARAAVESAARAAAYKKILKYGLKLTKENK